MRVALYGKRTEELKQYKENLEIGFKRIMDQDVNIDYYRESNILEQRILDYDIVIFSEILMKKLEEELENEKRKNIIFTTKEMVAKCFIDDILYIEADLKKVHIGKKGGDIVLSIPISKVEQLLDGKGFIKTHRSYIVNASHITSIRSDAVILDDDIRIPVSKYRIKDVREQYLVLCGRGGQYM